MRRPDHTAVAFDLGGFAAALLDPAHPTPPGLRAWNGSDPGARLAVHRNNVLVSLVDALADTFPVVQQLVGDTFFRAMAAVFVRQSPPRSSVLAHYGQDFPAFVAQFEPAQALPYLADMAQLEAARVRAYHAADAEPVSAAAIGLAFGSGERMGELRPALHPSVCALASAHAVVTLWAAHQGEGEMPLVDIDSPENAIVLRDGLDVLVLPAPAGAVVFVRAVLQGCNLGAAAASAADAEPGFDLTATLTLLLAHGALVSLHLPPGYDA